MLRGFAKKAIPFLMRTVAPEALEMGKGVLSDVLEGRKLRESLKDRGVRAARGVGGRLIRGGRIIKKKKNCRRKRYEEKKKK